ncbi:MAG: hypothetical protein ACSHWU_07050, partial [Marinicella sp.]
VIISAQTNDIQLINSMHLIGGIEIPHYVVAYFEADINFEDMRTIPDSVTINLPDGTTTTVHQTYFIGRSGYTYSDPPEPRIIVTPGATLEDMRYFWAGSDFDQHVTMTVYGTRILSSIWSNGKKYLIQYNSETSSNLIFELLPVPIRPGPIERVDVLNFKMLLLLVSVFILAVGNKFRD